MGQDHFDEAKPMEQYTEEERHRDDPKPADDEAQKTAEAEWMRQQAMEMFARMEYRRERDRMYEQEYRDRMHRRGYSRFNNSYFYRNHYDISSEDEQQFSEISGPLIGIIVAVITGAGFGASELGTYLILAAVGFYLGLFLKHNAFGDMSAVEAFRETRPGLFIALGLIIVGLISYFKPLF